jgi:hypothetical protein
MGISRIYLAFFAFSFVVEGIAQHDQGGFLKPADSLSKKLPVENIIYLPQDGFSFYEAPAGLFKGKILPGPPLGEENEVFSDSLLMSTITGVTIRPQLVSTDNYFETSNSRYHLMFDQQKENHVLVFVDSYHGWISTQEISEKGFALVTWMEFYGKSKGLSIHPINKIASIYQYPNAGAKAIGTADELYSEITTTGKSEGTFCFVKVTQYRNPYDPEKSREQNTLKKYKGWIKIIDEEGRPLVAQNSQGGF